MSQDARLDEENATQRRAGILGLNYVNTATIQNKTLYKGTLSLQEMYQNRVLPLQIDKSNILFGITTTTSQQVMNDLGARFSDVRLQFAIISDTGYREYMRFDHENAVLPTLEDVDVVCDLRPVFEDTVFPIPEAKLVRHTKLVEYIYMVLVDLSTEDPDGRRRRIAFQMTEATLADLQTALQRAKEQLDILKASTSAISTQEP